METESVKSGLSEQSLKSKKSKHRNNHRSHSHRSHRSHKPDNTMAPFQTAVTLEDARDGQEVIQVQILPQDENWGENTTAITGNTSEQSESNEDLSQWMNDNDTGFSFACQRVLVATVTGAVSAAAFLSPLAMVVLPKLGVFPALNPSIVSQHRLVLLTCGAECKGLLVSLAFKMLLLAAGAWAVFLRPAVATMPRIFLFRSAIILLVFICSFVHWLFYIVQCKRMTQGEALACRSLVASRSVLLCFMGRRIIWSERVMEQEQVTEQAALAVEPDSVQYSGLVTYASTLTDTLLFILFVAVVLIEIRHLQPLYYIKVVRSPDGESRSYAIGQLSIQRTAVWVLQRYYTEFSIYNPYLERLPVSKARKGGSSFKFYDVDGVPNNSMQHSQSRAMLAAHARRRDSSHNERFYEEHEYERRVKKRRARLVTAAEEAFTHIKRLHNDQVAGQPMDPQEAAQAVFPSMARALQKFLRVTRQQPRFTAEWILGHLALCLRHDQSPRAFLEPFLTPTPVLSNEKDQKSVQSWSIVCEDLLSRPLRDGVTFQLRQNDVSLLCQIRVMPHFSLAEEIVHPKSNKFVLRLNSETSV